MKELPVSFDCIGGLIAIVSEADAWNAEVKAYLPLEEAKERVRVWQKDESAFEEDNVFFSEIDAKAKNLDTLNETIEKGLSLQADISDEPAFQELRAHIDRTGSFFDELKNALEVPLPQMTADSEFDYKVRINELARALKIACLNRISGAVIDAAKFRLWQLQTRCAIKKLVAFEGLQNLFQLGKSYSEKFLDLTSTAAAEWCVLTENLRKGESWLERVRVALSSQTTVPELMQLEKEAEGITATFSEVNNIKERICSTQGWSLKVRKLLMPSTESKLVTSIKEVEELLAEGQSLLVLLPEEFTDLENVLEAARKTQKALSDMYSPRPARLSVATILASCVDVANRGCDYWKSGVRPNADKASDAARCFCRDEDETSFMICCGTCSLFLLPFRFFFCKCLKHVFFS